MGGVDVMADIMKTLFDAVGVNGIGNVAIVVVLGLFVWFFAVVIPNSIKRLVESLEHIAVTIAAHDERSLSIKEDCKEIKNSIDGLAKEGDLKEIEALLSNGSTQKFIANRYNTTEANLYNWMKRHNLKKS